jgi:hypothetical protein
MQGIFGGFYKLTDNMKIVNKFLKKKKTGRIRSGRVVARWAGLDPARREARAAGIRTYPRASAVSGTRVPNRYRASSVVRSSEDRRSMLVVYTGKGEGSGNPRVSPWF